MAKKSTQLPVPSPHIDESPSVQVCINREWADVLIAQVWSLKYPEAWGGTLDENRRARLEIQNLIDMLMSEDDCMNVCCEPQIYIFRINEDTGRFERSPDFGTTWQPDPRDPVYAVIKQKPITRTTVDKTKCDAASNFSEHFNDAITGTSENIGTAVTVFDLAVAVAGIIIDIIIAVGTGGAGAPVTIAIVDAIFAACAAAAAEGKTAFDGYWNSDKKDKVFCAAYCTIGDNGAFSQTQWEDFKHKVKAELPPSPALDMVLTTVNAAGYVGASNMASYGAAADADCSSCDCECSDPCTVTWTFFGVHDVVKISDCHYTMTTNGGGEHFAFTSGDMTVGCYWGGVGLITESVWPVGSPVPVGGINPATTPIWNLDTDFGSSPVALDFRFSAAPIS